MTQQEHDERHPGMVCQTCPKTLAFQATLRRRAEELRRRPWWRFW